ncbi:hypothetical protein SEA_BIGSWOLE_27 [Mycobacterium phage Bigswole]|uniref:Uncharacterized protein n=1 Tax=Mycobacterium phage Bigswole TaxID=2041521 RepID=A0A2D1G722_9CAUD|nr:hypothetical protein KHO58_gp027 [Mycobacterium phage Bigswole]ATN87705.1 hypothetical protein SEA_BIGSWOLE_27 [Mycobacterium phage Bigswole]
MNPDEILILGSDGLHKEWDGKSWPPPPGVDLGEVFEHLHNRILALETVVRELTKHQHQISTGHTTTRPLGTASRKAGE